MKTRICGIGSRTLMGPILRSLKEELQQEGVSTELLLAEASLEPEDSNMEQQVDSMEQLEDSMDQEVKEANSAQEANMVQAELMDNMQLEVMKADSMGLEEANTVDKEQEQVKEQAKELAPVGEIIRHGNTDRMEKSIQLEQEVTPS